MRYNADDNNAAFLASFPVGEEIKRMAKLQSPPLYVNVLMESIANTNQKV